jgi:hypothetical protein
MPRKSEKSPDKTENPLGTSAQTIGEVAGQVTSVVGARPKPAAVNVIKVTKLQKKNKSRLPRRQKKAQWKAASR